MFVRVRGIYGMYCILYIHMNGFVDISSEIGVLMF